MARVYYVDTAIPSDRKKRKKHKTHAVFDGVGVFRVKKLTELEDASEIYIDALFSELYGEILELLKRGVRVYLLRDATKLKKLRMENNLKKSDENDAALLARIPKEKFRTLTAEELELKMKMRPLINEYEKITRWRKTLKKLLKDGFDYNFKEVIRLMEASRWRISKEIIEQVVASPIYGEVYKKACKMLGVRKSTELAILVIELPLYLPLVKLKGLLGLIPGKNKGRYHHKLRGHIAALAVNLYTHAKRGVSNEAAKVVNHLPLRQGVFKLELIILKILRIAYLMTAKPLADEQ